MTEENPQPRRRHSSIIVERLRNLDRRGKVIATGVVAFLFWLLIMAAWWLWAQLQVTESQAEAVHAAASHAEELERASSGSAAWRELLAATLSDLQLLEDHWRRAPATASTGQSAAARGRVEAACQEVAARYPHTRAPMVIRALAGGLAGAGGDDWPRLPDGRGATDDAVTLLCTAQALAMRAQQLSPHPGFMTAGGRVGLRGLTETPEGRALRTSAAAALESARATPSWAHLTDAEATVVLLEALNLSAAQRYEEAVEQCRRIADDPWLGATATLLRSQVLLETGQFEEAVAVVKPLIAREWHEAIRLEVLGRVGLAVNAEDPEQRQIHTERAASALAHLREAGAAADKLAPLRAAIDALKR